MGAEQRGARLSWWDEETAGRAWTCVAGELPRGPWPPPRMHGTENGQEGELASGDDLRAEDIPT